MRLVGLCYPVLEEKEVPARILVNGQPVFEGPAPFGDEALTTHELALPSGVLREGENEITILNTAPEGSVGSRPWFGVDRVEFHTGAGKP